MLLLFFLNNLSLCFSQEAKIKVYVFVAEECPVSLAMTPSLRSVSEQYAAAEFYLVFPMTTSTAEGAEAFKKENKLSRFSIKVDHYQTLTKKMGATVTPEAIITSTDGTVLYKGRINDSYLQPGKKKHTYVNEDLADALAAASAGREMPKPWKPAVGCFITLEK